MLNERVSVVIFEGGVIRDSLDEVMAHVRKAVVLDNAELIRDTEGVDEVLICTNYPDLAKAAEDLGCIADLNHYGEDFHFGRYLQDVVRRHQLENVLYMSGAGAPLITREDIQAIAEQLRCLKNVVIVNNVQSIDFAAFTPARAIHMIEPPATDNVLGRCLRELGLRRILVENSARVNFDLDTPTDILILSLHRGVGRRTAEALGDLDWDKKHLLDARHQLLVCDQQLVELALIGRVAPSVMLFLNANFPLRLRVFSEERGMRALNRAEKGEVVSLVSTMIDWMGPKAFFEKLSSLASVVFMDTRVTFAHWKKKLSDWDRFHSDLGQVSKIQDEQLREFTEAAFSCGIPVVLGGHSLVSGGIWLLAEDVLKDKGLHPRPVQTFGPAQR